MNAIPPSAHAGTGAPPASGSVSRGARILILVVLAFVVAAVATRLPLLTGPILIDGDEAVVGLQALDPESGGPVPVLFPGQKYGVTTLEAGLARLVFRVAGPSETNLRLAALAIWIAGGALAIRFASRWGTTAMLVAALLLVANPAWYEWSVKARGGYVTAWFLAMLALGLGWRRRAPRHGLVLFAFGAVLGVIPLAQPAWAGLAIGFLLLAVADRRNVAPVLAGLVLSGTLAFWIAARAPGFWNPGESGGASPLLSLAAIPGRLATLFHGAYYLHRPLPVDGLGRIAGLAWTVAALGLPLLVWRGRLRALPAAVILTLALTVLLPGERFGYRYLLPIAAIVPVLAACVVQQCAGLARHAVVACTLALAVLGMLRFPALPDGREARAAEALAIERTASDLARNDVRHAFVLDPILQWNLMFASRGTLTARWFGATDRIPAYPAAVDRALREQRKVVVVGRPAAVSRVREAVAAARPVPPPHVVDGRLAWFPVLPGDRDVLAASGFTHALQ